MVGIRRQFEEEVLHRRQRGGGVRGGTVDLVDDEDRPQPLLERDAQDVAGLGHGALDSVDDQQASVGHVDDALDLAAEIGVARRVDDVDHHVAVLDPGVLGQDGDAALSFLRVRVHDQIGHLLTGAEDMAVTQHRVDEARLTVVDVRDDGDVAEVGLGCFSHIPSVALHGSAPAKADATLPSMSATGFGMGFPCTHKDTPHGGGLTGFCAASCGHQPHCPDQRASGMDVRVP